MGLPEVRVLGILNHIALEAFATFPWLNGNHLVEDGLVVAEKRDL